MLRFVRFQEYNDHEGEVWDFWLQLDGNEVELRKLDQKLNDPWYTLHMDNAEPEVVVDKFVEYANVGYFYSDTKVVGKFTCPDTIDPPDNYFYKGGITDYFHD